MRLRYGLGIALVAAGSLLGLIGYRRFRSNEQAMRSGRELGPSPAGPVVATVVVVLPLLAAVGLAVLAVF